ncbi:amino acid adenylation domain-containing protein [Aurantibacter crassamenti]|uniref:polyketide synthase n=1 Tax=Aurantibacter crassamenti TaxID=1837375 RepID=UPI001939CB0C|nr:polyketide synthase [Aurantibacter crassamenti]MBM1105825.1 amino acid adenylation domain-containing protein [Aurantibacter crassamenti]
MGKSVANSKEKKNGSKQVISQNNIVLNKVLTDFNDTNVSFPIDKTVIDFFIEQVEQNPNKLAVVYGTNQLTFKELDELSNRLANSINHKVSKKESFIGVFMNRSAEMIIAILGILKSGAAYAPIDPKYPKDRINYILKDSQIDLIISDSDNSEYLKSISDNEVIELNKNWFASNNEPIEKSIQRTSPNDLAYIIYTSGSTGNPKGVINRHASLLNYLLASSSYIDKNSDSSGSFAHLSLSFDASITEMFLPLITGKCLVLSTGTGLAIFEDPNLIKYAPFDFIKLTPAHTALLAPVLQKEPKNQLAYNYIFGGEALYNYHIDYFRASQIDATIINEYGPTEATVGCCIYKFNTLDEAYSNENIPIGMPIANTQIYILDQKQNKLPFGDTGEICIGGKGLANGYLNRETLTEEKFCTNPFDSNTRIYRTGDLGRFLPDGNLEFMGRQDEQVKISGHRIELGEIEAALIAIPEIKLAAVTVHRNPATVSRLIAYLQPEGAKLELNIIRKVLADTLPDFMLPSNYIWVTDFPLTPNGKIDKKNLPSQEYVRPDSAPLLKKPRTKLEKDIAKIWSEQLQVPVIGIDDNFFEMGGSSLLSQMVANALKQQLKLEIPVAKIYQYPTIKSLANYIKPTNKKTQNFSELSKNKTKKTSADVAIIGMAGRFPGAQSIEELWEVLSEGKETISFFSPEELDSAIPEILRNDPLYVSARGIVPSAETFDAKFFGLNPKVASVMDPQIRLFLEISWEVLEKSGHLPKHFNGSIGVYAGTGTNTYFNNNVLPNNELINQVGLLQANTLNDKDYIASRISYHLNLKGPAVSVHSACSTSLLAIAEATEAIRNGQCEIALAGGSNITAPMFSGHLYQEGSMLSPDGHSRSFDADAKGTVFSDGAGVVLLKSLEAAEKDGDIIYGIVKGVGINNDGGGKGSFTAPSVEGQADAISRALYDAKVPASSISYIETHGTATPLGDPIEMEGLHMAFGEQEKKGYCAIGSIKSNMGHCTAAAGVAGLMKTVLAMNHRQIPASLGYEKPNPEIDFENGPFFVNAALNDWKIDKGNRRAGISSFGVGGTNVHIVVEEYPIKPKKSDLGRPVQLLPWSAKSENSLNQYSIDLGNYIKSNSVHSLAEVSYSLKMTRDDFNHRRFIIANDSEEAAEQLLNQELNKINLSNLKVEPSEVAFLFPGQGAQYLQMGKALYTHETVYKNAIDVCAEILKKDLELDIRDIIFPESSNDAAELKLKDTRFTQPALFVTEYALAQLWMSWGIKPTLVCGHSIGEFVAAHLAGVFSLEDALHIIATRGRLISELPGGSMLSVRLASEQLVQLLPERLSIAAINSDSLCVVSGPDVEIENFSKTLKDQNVPNRLLITSHAFHSSMMDPALDSFKKEIELLKLKTPRLPIVSTVTGDWLTDKEATSADYWTNHLRASVCFSNAMDTILALDDVLLLEVGPGKALTTLARQKKAAKSKPIISSLPIPKEDQSAYHNVLNALGQLWLNGLEPDWQAFYKEQVQQKIVLPSYAFDRKPCWIKPITTQPLISVSTSEENSTANTPIEAPIVENINTELGRESTILKKISAVILNASGIEVETEDYSLNFLELGLDSLILTQIATTCKREFNIPITFRQLNEEFDTPHLLAKYLDKSLPPEISAPVPNKILHGTIDGDLQKVKDSISTFSGNNNQESKLELILNQLEQLNKRIDTLQENGIIQSKASTLTQNNGLNGHYKNETTETHFTINGNANFKTYSDKLNTPPVAGAKLGRDENGDPAWFILDDKNEDEFIKIDLQ